MIPGSVLCLLVRGSGLEYESGANFEVRMICTVTCLADRCSRNSMASISAVLGVS